MATPPNRPSLRVSLCPKREAISFSTLMASAGNFNSNAITRKRENVEIHSLLSYCNVIRGFFVDRLPASDLAEQGHNFFVAHAFFVIGHGSEGTVHLIQFLAA